MRVAVSVLALCVAAGALAGCSSYSRYEHEQQLHAERNGRWTDEERDWRREPARRDTRERRRTGSETAARRPPATRTTAAPAPRSALNETRMEPAAAVAAPPPAPPPKVTAAPSPPRPPVASPPSASAPPPVAAAATVKPPAAEAPGPALIAARKEIADGYRLLRAGFVKKARERFDAAMTAAAGEATLGHGRSFDPSYLKGVAFPDAEPDVEEARKLYRRAILLGAGEAKGDLERLEKATATAQPAVPPESPAKPGG